MLLSLCVEACSAEGRAEWDLLTRGRYRGGRHGRWFLGVGVYSMFMHGHSGMPYDIVVQTLAFLQSRDGACRAFTDQADIACTKREAP